MSQSNKSLRKRAIEHKAFSDAARGKNKPPHKFGFFQGFLAPNYQLDENAAYSRAHEARKKTR